MTRKKYKKLMRKFLTDFYSKYPIEGKPGMPIKNTMTNIDNGAVRGSYAENWSKLEQVREELEF